MSIDSIIDNSGNFEVPPTPVTTGRTVNSPAAPDGGLVPQAGAAMINPKDKVIHSKDTVGNITKVAQNYDADINTLYGDIENLQQGLNINNYTNLDVASYGLAGVKANYLMRYRDVTNVAPGILKDVAGAALADVGGMVVRAFIPGLSTTATASALFWREESAWKVRTISRSSNDVISLDFILSGGVPAVTHNSGATMDIVVEADIYRMGDAQGNVNPDWFSGAGSGTKSWKKANINFVADTQYNYEIHLMGASVMVSMPPNPQDGDEIIFTDALSAASQWPIIFSGNGKTVNGTTQVQMGVSGTTTRAVYNEGNWRLYAMGTSNANSVGGMKIITLTQAEYDALGAYDANTLYFIS